ncbi:MAG: septum formation initiator family protein [Lachnospiraceae bacterium]|nr:septum formation initiator family protein [Lachnospiraceae bacterium]MDD7629176.1 septum formation initiator family protein [Lachnospiraceae bacterium]MDY4118734.1 septum formation initiator family protein [Lachnospiraceae bacterium]
MARRVAYRKRRQNKFGMFLVFLVVIMIGVVVAVRSVDMKATLAENRQREAELQDQIAAEQERAEEIEEMEKYSETLGYTEDVAKEKLGLINEGEIIFRDESH